ncbi:MAG: cation:proton antiporter [Limisphaerales bacterium]
MIENHLLSLALILVLGISAQWVAWRLRLPSILLLLLFGFVAGPWLGWVNPDQLLGDWLMPLVSVSVGLILFEGGLTLKFRELKSIGGVVRNLITVGALITWVVATVAARICFDWSWALSTLLGAILTVTGPTVVMPLLRHIQPARQVGSLLKWEGILIDPVGAVLALLVFEAILPHATGSVSIRAALGFTKTLLVGVSLGTASAWILTQSFKRYWVPDHLQNPVALMGVIGVFTLSNGIQHESGLLTVTVMGIALANQRSVYIRHIIEFKENLRVLLISSLFILLASRVQLDDLRQLSPVGGLGFLAALALVARPLSVLACGAGSKLSWKEKLFLAWMAPRGIVAAAVASIFAMRLAEAGIPRAQELVPVTFLVIVGTVILYGLTAGPLANQLGLSRPNPQGVLILGAHRFARAIGKTLQSEGFQVLLADTNWENLGDARLDGLPTYYGNVLSEQARDELDLNGLGRLLALTPNQEVNTLAAIHFVEFFGRSEVYQVQVHSKGGKKTELDPHGRLLFEEGVFLEDIFQRLQKGAVLRKTQITAGFTFSAWMEKYGDKALPLFLISGSNALKIWTQDDPPAPGEGQTLVALVPESEPVPPAPPEPSCQLSPSPAASYP